MRNDPLTPDHSEPSVDWEALARYLAGESSAAESERITRWLTEHKADAELLTALDNAMAGLALRDQFDVDVEGALARLAALRDAPSIARPPSPRNTTRDPRFTRRRISPSRSAGFLAAAAAIVLAAWLVLYRSNDGQKPGRSAPGGAARTFASTVGRRDSLVLPDGGRVILGAASRLTIAATYGQPVREVELHGEAYFAVVHDEGRPFVVRAGGAVIRDIGTTFAVRSDSGARVQVVVTSGSVALRAAAATDSGALLTAGDIGSLDADDRVTTQHEGSTGAYLAWMRDSLVFRDAPLSEVSGKLRRWYGVVLRADDSALVGRHLTMSFSGDPLERVLRVIGLGLGADVERRGDTAIVHSSNRSGRTQ